MKNTIKLFVIIVFVVIIGFSMAACSHDGGGGGTDSWSTVTSSSQINGTWKGSYSESHTIKEYQGDAWTQEDENFLGSDFRETVTVEITATVNTPNYTETRKITCTYSGSKINTVWAALVIEPNYIVDDSKHTITYTEALPTRKLSDKEIAGMVSSLQINQNGTKIKVPANLMGEHPAMTFYKQ